MSRNTVLFIFSLLLLFALGEVLMRTCGPKPWFAFKGKEADRPPDLNSLGFRDEEITDETLRKELTRVLFLGDSFTFGSGVKKTSCFAKIIEKRLNSIPLKPFACHIYNAGLNGTNPDSWYESLKKLLPIYKSQLVFAIFFLRDGTSFPTSYKFNLLNIDKIKKKYENKVWYRYSYIGRYIASLLIQKEFSYQFLEEMRDAYLGSNEQKKTWHKQQEYLLKIRDLCRQNKVDFHLVIFPMLFNLEKKYKFYDIEAEIVKFARDSNMPVYSLTPGFIGQKSSALWLSDNDQHPNEKGHMIAANTLYPYVEKVIERKQYRNLEK